MRAPEPSDVNVNIVVGTLRLSGGAVSSHTLAPKAVAR